MIVIRGSLVHSKWLQKLEHEVHIWLVSPDQINEPAKLSAYTELLSTDERARQQRFHFEKDRHSYLVSHALVRTVLSKYAAIKPADWQFSNGVQGRPEIVTGSGVPPLRFNLSHTSGLVACVVSREIACGIDVEKIVERGNPQAIAERMFAPTEIKDLNQRVGADYLDGFFTYWTLREAYYKALGTGLVLSDNSHAFVANGVGLFRLDTQSNLQNTALNDWYFEVHRPTSDHIVSVAILPERGDICTVIVDSIIP